jgi:hypothetical protein
MPPNFLSSKKKEVRRGFRNPLPSFTPFFKVTMDYDEDDDFFDDTFFDEIVRRRMIPRRTNWRYRLIALNQREAAEAAMLQSSILMHVNFIVALIVTVNQLLLGLRVLHSQQQNPTSLQCVSRVVLYYSNLALLCFYQLDYLLVE